MTVKNHLSKISLLLVLSAATPPAWAGPILVERLFVPTVSEFVRPKPLTSTTISFANEDEIPVRPGDSRASNPSNRFNRTTLALLRRGNVLSKRGVDDNNPTITAHYIGVSLYHAIYGIDSGVANDLLASYHAIGSVRDEITAVLKAPLSAIGLGTDQYLPENQRIASDGISNNYIQYDDTLHKSDLEKLFELGRLMLSLRYVPYYILVLGMYLLFVTARARRSTRRAGRSGSVHLASTHARRHRDDPG